MTKELNKLNKNKPNGGHVQLETFRYIRYILYSNIIEYFRQIYWTPNIRKQTDITCIIQTDRNKALDNTFQ